ncbi:MULTISPECIES: hypothetical protein [unclassified Microcoleus]|uniref:hypothetical protein n=1 Tax=unclassified Microcoleus TaxID=2642155 RepID=UPI002FD02CC9
MDKYVRAKLSRARIALLCWNLPAINREGRSALLSSLVCDRTPLSETGFFA